ncbi:MAG: folylpolyglutamate synthase/dihydrofolate synthase family protein [Elusimicrobiota bacterium]
MKDLDLWQKREYTGMKPGLARIHRFLKICGEPHKRFSAVHIAGTNGKGSTAKMLSDILAEAGYRAGLFISPNIYDITERIQINSEPIKRNKLSRLVRIYSRKAEDCGLTFFEFMTGIAFIYFAQEKIDIAVIETGLGGRFDATNTLKNPLACIITDIDLDHKAVLGNTISRIAFEKAGIIKKGCPVISGAENSQAAKVISSVARKRKSAEFRIYRDFDFTPIKTDWVNGNQLFRYNGIKFFLKLSVRLLGVHQLKNCSLSLAACELLRQRGFKILNSHIISAMKNVRWAGRFEVITRGNRTYVVDGAHNPGAIRRFAGAWRSSPWAKKPSVFIFGMLKDKDYGKAIKILSEATDKVIICPVDSPRNAPVGVLSGIWKKYLPAGSVSTAESASAALEAARENTVAVVGSLYLAGEILRKIKPTPY